MSDDDGNTFHYTYNFSSEPAARFINTAIAQGQDGTGLASGVYFYRLASGGFVRTLPMILLK